MRRTDRLIAATVTVAALIGLVIGWLAESQDLRLAPLVVALCLLQGLVLLRRRQFPIPVLFGSTAAVVALGLLQHPSAGGAMGPLAAAYAVGAYARSRWAAVALVPVVSAISLVDAGMSVSPGRGGPTLAAMLISSGVVYSAVFMAGRLARSRRDAQVERTRAAVAEERVRIARELHDVVAHHIGVMALHAGAGRRLVSSDPDAARQAFSQIEASGREALAAMPHLVGSLRDAQPSDGPEAPQPRLADLPRLIAEVRGAGLPVELRIAGEPRLLPAPVELSAYRIVQEALTNAGRHARPTLVEVVVGYRPDALDLEVLDDGAGNGSADTAVGGGFGLTGIRERVASLDGTCEIGPRPLGGFSVSARLPLTAAVVG